MPVKSSNSSVIKWPDLRTVKRSLAGWVEEQLSKKPELLQVGFFGSYARGDWGVGSDLDVILIVSESSAPFYERGLEWDINRLPVPVDLVVYTIKEWKEMAERGERFYKVVETEAKWLYKVGIMRS